MDVVVVGVDGSGNASKALRVAIQEAAWRNAKVHAIHAVHYPVAGIDPIMLDVEVLRSAGQEMLDRQIDAVREEHPDGLPVDIETSVHLGHSGIGIMSVNEHSDEDKTVLTVVGSRGLGGFVGLLLGSVTTYLVHHLEGPLLIVPHENAEAEQPAQDKNLEEVAS